VKKTSHPLAELAREAITKYITGGETISPPVAFPKEFLNKKAGVFVSIHSNGNLRGCIGTYGPTKANVAEETIANAISAAAEDIRFEPITAAELPVLNYDIYVLDEPVLIKDISELDVNKYGIIVAGLLSGKRGLLLPGLEGIESVEEQIYIAAQKAGIDLKKEKISIYRFTADKY